jgi:hypothetical protein
MMNRQSNRSSLRCHVTRIVLAPIILLGALIVHSIAARWYYNLNSQSMRLVASIAVRAGTEYLPSDPRTAVLIADGYARRFGIASNEIMSTDVSADDNTLTIRLSRKVPEYISLFAVGLPDRTISVTASGQLQKGEGGSGRGAPSIEAL